MNVFLAAAAANVAKDAAAKGAAAAQGAAAAAADAAQAVQTQASPFFFKLPGHWPAQGDLLTWCQNMGPAMAALLVLMGMIFLMFGVQFYRALVTLNAAAFGGYIGAVLGNQAGNAMAGALVGGFAAAALTWPLMKYAVAVMGGVFGGLLGASILRSIGLDPHYAWAGAMMGLIFFGMLSFLLFRGSIMMYTSLQGSVMLVFGLLGMIYKYQDLAPRITESLKVQPFLLPLFIFIPATIGLIYQQTQYPAAPAAKK